MAVKIKNYSKKYSGDVIFENFNLDIESEKITAILGGSGVGKSTLLNSVATLEQYNGTIDIDEAKTSYVFHNSALVGGLTVYDNLALVLSPEIRDKSTQKSIIMKALKDVELESYASAYPSSLSAGMAQRVSIARAFLVNADLILMDEPFKGLDVGVKSRLIKNFIKMWEKQRKTVIIVTHSIDEAVLLADKVVVLDGRPVQIAATYKINSPQSSRSMSDDGIADVFASCYSVLTK